MAKTPKPSFQHTTPAVQVSSRQQYANQKTGKRRKIAQPKSSGQTMTDGRWKKIVASIANGNTREQAARFAGLTLQTIDAYLISNVAAFKQLRDAMLVWNRRSWGSDLIERVFDDLAMGFTLKAAALHNGVAAQRMPALYRLVRHDKQIRAAYDDARELQAESFLDEIIDIADDSGADRLENGKINYEVVNRSKLKIDTRRFAMGVMVKKRFGESKQIEHEGTITVNHIATLTGARKRLEKARPATPPMKVPVIIDNDTGELAEG